MHLRLIGYSLSILLVVAGCLRKQPAPYQLRVEKYVTNFPSTAADILRAYPQAVWGSTAEPSTVVLNDTLGGNQASWRFTTTTHLPKDSSVQLYGVLITLVGKGNKIDSIQAALERRYGRPFQRLTTREHVGKYEEYAPDSSLRVMQINEDVQLTLGRQNAWNGIVDLQNIVDNVTLSICYACDEEERERFALAKEIHRRAYD